ncbi:MAG TPA: hypothetical protein VGK67_25055 [Myxococcales bacterium]|jgi:hypothetical protein
MTPCAVLLALLAAAAPVQAQPMAPLAPAGPAKVLADEDPPAASYQGNSSARLAAPVVVRFDPAFQDLTPVLAANGGASEGTTNAASAVLSRNTPAVARRHFEEAKWTTGTGKGRELVIKSVTVTFRQGPSYQVQVIVDRVQDGRRLGQATGSGQAAADHSKDQARARWAPGPWGRAAHNEASRPHISEDAPVIQQATIRALDTALNQLGAVWGSEQQAEMYRKQAEEQVRAAQKAAAKK